MKNSILVLSTLVLLACAKPSKNVKVAVNPIVINSVKDTTVLNVKFEGKATITSVNSDSVYVIEMKQVK